MTAKRKLEIEVSAELAEELDALVARGVEESLSEFVEASLWDSLLPPPEGDFTNREAAKSHLRELIPEIASDPGSCLTADELRESLAQHRRANERGDPL